VRTLDSNYGSIGSPVAFKDNSLSPKNAYKDNSVNFSINIGLNFQGGNTINKIGTEGKATSLVERKFELDTLLNELESDH
jgi:hypothetical protein